jgi:phosphoenolpyruvate-protein kinase (PTS system EI component)
MLRTVKGIAASDGIGIAKAYTLIEPDLSFEKKTIDDPAAEYQRLKLLLTSQSRNWRPSSRTPRAA